MAAPTFSTLTQRYLDLIGQPDGTITDFGKRNINRAIRDVINRYPFSWNIKTGTGTLSSGVFTLPTDYNPASPIDARIVVDGDDHIFTRIEVWDRDTYTDADYVYWVLPNASNPDEWTFNTHVQTGDVTLHYYFLPADLSADADKCIIPDIESVSYLAASKNWIGSERNVELKREYELEADKYINAMYFRDLQASDSMAVQSIVGINLG
jgi:hypothetical protein